MSTTLSVEEAQEALAKHWSPSYAGPVGRAFEALARAAAREEIARSRAPVGEDVEAQEARKAGKEAAERICAKVYGDPNRRAPTPPAKDTGETRAPNYADMTSPQLLAEISDLERRIAKAIDELHGVEAGDSSVYEVIDILDPKATLNREEDERIADLEARLAEAIRERDEARSSLETAVEAVRVARNEIAAAAVKEAGLGDETTQGYMRVTAAIAVVTACSRIRAALTPDAGTARSEDEEGK